MLTLQIYWTISGSEASCVPRLLAHGPIIDDRFHISSVSTAELSHDLHQIDGQQSTVYPEPVAVLR